MKILASKMALWMRVFWDEWMVSLLNSGARISGMRSAGYTFCSFFSAGVLNVPDFNGILASATESVYLKINWKLMMD